MYIIFVIIRIKKIFCEGIELLLDIQLNIKRAPPFDDALE